MRRKITVEIVSPLAGPQGDGEGSKVELLAPLLTGSVIMDNSGF